MIGYAFCGSFCTFDRSISVLKELVHDYDVLPIMSHNAASTDTRFGKSADFINTITDICRRDPVLTIKDAEPLGPARPLDALVIAPCTGNTLAKLANGITDTSVIPSSASICRKDTAHTPFVLIMTIIADCAQKIKRLHASFTYFASLLDFSFNQCYNKQSISYLRVKESQEGWKEA